MKLLAILAREVAVGIQLNILVTTFSLFSGRSLKDISSQVNEDLLIQGWNGFVYFFLLTNPWKAILLYLPANPSLPL